MHETTSSESEPPPGAEVDPWEGVYADPKDRAQAIEKGNAARRLTPSISYQWELQRDERKRFEDEIKKLRAEIRKLKAGTKRNNVLDEEILNSLGRTPVSAGTVQFRIGNVNARIVRRALARLVKECRINRIGGGNNTRYAKPGKTR